MLTPSQGTQAKRKILLLDDEERILIALRAVLRHEYAVTIVTDGQKALDLLRQEDFHVFISDQRMPGLTGVEVLKAAVEIAPATTRLLLTGYSDLAAIIGSINEGEVFRFLNKPWDNNELIATVREAAEVAEAAKTVFVANPALLAEPSTALPAPGASVQDLHDALVEPVLVLESSSTLAGELEALMRGRIRTLWARTPDEALALLAEHPVGVIVVDIGVNPQVIDLLKVLKQQYPQVLSIVTTERGESNLLIDLINQVKIFRYLHKPYKVGLIERYLQSALQTRERFRAAPALVRQQTPARLAQDTLAFTAGLMDKVRALGARLALKLAPARV